MIIFLFVILNSQPSHKPAVGDLYTIEACHPGRGGVYAGCATIVGEKNGLFLTHEYWLNEAGTSWGYFDYEKPEWFSDFTFQDNWSNEVPDIQFK